MIDETPETEPQYTEAKIISYPPSHPANKRIEDEVIRMLNHLCLSRGQFYDPSRPKNEFKQNGILARDIREIIRELHSVGNTYYTTQDVVGLL